MKIEFPMQGNNQTNDKLNMAISHETSARIAGETYGYTLDISGKDKDITAFGMEELDSFEDVAMKASTKNVALESKANVVMSNSLSKEDFAEYQREGYSPANMDVEDVVTNLDKIKAVLLESGVVVEGYTDDISDETLNKITGSQAVTDMIRKAFADEYIPVTEDNVSEVNDLISIASELKEPTEDAKKYMIINNMTPTVQNFYLAQFSSGNDTNRHALYYVDKSGYTSVKPQTTDWDSLKPQAEKIIENAGLEVNEKTLTEAKWLIDKDIPLTKENIENLEKLSTVVFPIKGETIVKSSAAAIADGILPKFSDLTNDKGLFRKAVEIKDEVTNYIDSIPKENIKDARILEETRLHMTVEANLHLLKKGISIDTKNLEKLVDDLKQAEKEIYEPLLTNNKDDSKEVISDKELFSRIDLYKSVQNVVSEIKTVPVESVISIAKTGDELNLLSICDSGRRLKASYEEAGKSYEALMTAPRGDLGDSIKKAFRNVDEILDDIGLKVNEINEKAVRSLGYAEIEITKENIEEASKVNTTVENVISLMTPAKTLSMIRNGENPLDINIYELNEMLMNDEEKTQEKYSEFLWKLDKAGEITAEEKNAFIGMYRLFRQIEKSDGKLVGNVLKQGDTVTLNNLLTASRSNRAQGMDVSVDENFGALEKLISYGDSITDQILQGFRGNKAFEKDYIKEQTDEIREAVQLEEGVMRALENSDEPMTPSNMAAMNQLMNERGMAFEKLMGKSEKSSDKSKKIKDGIQKLHERFTDKDNADSAYEEMMDTAEEIGKDSVEQSDNIIDLKEMILVNKQISIARNISKNSQYEVPVEINGRWTSINLKLVKDGDETGMVSVSFDTEQTGKVSAEFKISSGKVNGFVVCEKNSGKEFIQSKEDILNNSINAINLKIESIYYTQKADININGEYDNTKENASTKTADIYSFAKAFIGVVQTA